MIILFVVVFLACTVGAVCGIGGGVVIKPVLDFVEFDTTQVINFLSGCTVLSMSFYTVGKSLYRREGRVKTATATPLAIGAILGGMLGKQLFSYLLSAVPDAGSVRGIQAICLGVLTLFSLIYTLCKDRIHAHRVKNKLLIVLIGLVLGILSSFLGIGGGPFNLIFLYFFFDMDTKTAAANSLYIILFSQLANLLMNIFTHTVPDIKWTALVLMVVAGICGGACGRAVNKKISGKTVERLFLGLLCLIILICVYNAVNGFAAM